MNIFITDQKPMEKGLLLSNGLPNKNKLNLISGALSTAFADMLSACTSKTKYFEYVLDILPELHPKNVLCMKLLAVLYDVMGMDMPDILGVIGEKQEVYECFMHEFMADLNAIFQEANKT